MIKLSRIGKTPPVKFDSDKSSSWLSDVLGGRCLDGVAQMAIGAQLLIQGNLGG
jgi:hypothetical protein